MSNELPRTRNGDRTNVSGFVLERTVMPLTAKAY